MQKYVLYRRNKKKQATKIARKQNLSSSLMYSHNSMVTDLGSCWFALVLLWPWGIFKTQQQCCIVQQLSSFRVDFWALLSRANDLQSSSHLPALEELSCCGLHNDGQAKREVALAWSLGKNALPQPHSLQLSECFSNMQNGTAWIDPFWLGKWLTHRQSMLWIPESGQMRLVSLHCNLLLSLPKITVQDMVKM